MNCSEKLWKEYAIEPEVLDNWCNIRIFLFHLGFENGRILINFPSEGSTMKWSTRVKECAKKNVKQVEYHRCVEKLNRLCVPSNRHYQDEISWIDNAIIENKKNQFYAVIHNSDRNFEEDNFYLSQDIYEDHPVWKIDKTMRIQKNSETIARIAEPLFKHANKIKFIDPYFDPGKTWYKDAFNTYLKTVYQFQNPYPKVEIHCKYYLKDKDGNIYDSNKWKDVCQKIDENIPKGEKIDIVRWRRLKEGDKPHARYILSIRGGMGIEYGLDDGQKGNKTDIYLLNDKMVSQIWNNYYIYESASSDKYDFLSLGKEK
ncbi:MAG: hypothetical protein AB1656_10970 [Candidatus Omnitrophota bacterium]